MTSRQTSSSGSPIGSTTVLIPLVISIVLVILGISLGVFCFVGYRRRQRVWWRDFERRRRARNKDENIAGEGGPELWEVQVEDEKMAEGDPDTINDGKDTDGWRDTPLALTYHRDCSYSPSPSLQSISESFSTTSSTFSTTSVSTPCLGKTGQGKIEMTFLIAMPSPTPSLTRSRRSSPSSTSIDLKVVPLPEADIAHVETDDVPEMELAIVTMRLERNIRLSP